MRTDSVKDVNLVDLKRYTNNELKEMLIDVMADKYDNQIQSELLYDLVHKYVSLTEALNDKIEEVNRLSITDPLTQIYNRLHFSRAFDNELGRLKRMGEAFSFIIFDIDHFKSVNDTYGHHIGDVVLKGVADVVKSMIREVDVFARWGGEEFVILVEGSRLEEAVLLAERVRVAIETRKFDEVGHITCSFGVSEVIRTDKLETISQRADEALYQAKSTGRNKVCHT